MISAFQELSGENTKIISYSDSRFDSVVDKIKSKTPNEKFTEFVKSYTHKKILLLASTYSECEKILFPKLREILDLGYSVWIFPHKIDKPRIDEINNHLHAEVLSYSLYSTVKNPCKDRIVLFDVLGILAFAYFHGSLAYIGGAVHNKVHNVLEPAYFGLPLMTGEKILNSFDAINLRENKSLTVINSSDDFFKAVQKYSDEKEREKAYNKRLIQEQEQREKAGGADRIMLDNFSPEVMKQAIQLINGKYETEASGGITLENIRGYAATGVNYISVGALTHSYKSLDISMKIVK